MTAVFIPLSVPSFVMTRHSEADSSVPGSPGWGKVTDCGCLTCSLAFPFVQGKPIAMTCTREVQDFQ